MRSSSTSAASTESSELRTGRRPPCSSIGTATAGRSSMNTPATKRRPKNMDIELYGRVIWRHKLIVVLGFVLALTLAFLSYAKVGANGIGYRDSEQWVSYETMSVTQPGFMEGRLAAIGADPSRLTLLAVLYSKYADTDAVREAIWPNGPSKDESIEAAPVLALPGSSSTSALPIISIAAFSQTGKGSQRLAARTGDALIRYIEQRQD